jgi:DNA-binding NarL/FixJ family response regulator
VNEKNKIETQKTKRQLKEELTELRGQMTQIKEAENECRQLIEKTLRSSQTQAVINNLLYIALKNMSLESTLALYIDEITSLEWLALKSQGAIFLVGKYPKILEMKAHKALSPAMLEMCAKVPFGRCLCGRAALTAEIQFSDCVNNRHEFEYDGISPHGHYCVPIISGREKVVGVITLYLKEGHCRNQREENFLIAVANSVAGVIELKTTQRYLKEREEELQAKSLDLEEVNAALRVLLKKRDEDKIELEQKVFFNIEKLVKPYLLKMKSTELNSRQESYLTLMESNLDDISSPLTRRLTYKFRNLTASEFQVANLVLDGKRTKEIAMLLNVSDKTIEVHRKNIRKKLGLTNKKTYLRSYLLSIH